MKKIILIWFLLFSLFFAKNSFATEPDTSWLWTCTWLYQDWFTWSYNSNASYYCTGTWYVRLYNYNLTSYDDVIGWAWFVYIWSWTYLLLTKPYLPTVTSIHNWTIVNFVSWYSVSMSNGWLSRNDSTVYVRYIIWQNLSTMSIDRSTGAMWYTYTYPYPYDWYLGEVEFWPWFGQYTIPWSAWGSNCSIRSFKRPYLDSYKALSWTTVNYTDIGWVYTNSWQKQSSSFFINWTAVGFTWSIVFPWSFFSFINETLSLDAFSKPFLYLTNWNWINYLELTWSIDDNKFKLYDCSFDYQSRWSPIYNKSSNDNYFSVWTWILLDQYYKWLCLEFNNNWFSSQSLAYNFWDYTLKYQDTEICVKSNWDQYFWDVLLCSWSWCTAFDWTWSIDLRQDLVFDSTSQQSCQKKSCSLTDFGCHIDNVKLWFDFSCSVDLSKTASWTLVNTLSGQVNSVFTPLSTVISLLNITIPSTPDFSLDVPILYWLNSKVAYKTVNTTLNYEKDPLHRNWITANTTWKMFLSFVSAVIYIWARILILIWIFYLFRFYFLLLWQAYTSLTWENVKIDTAWNIWSLLFYVAYISVVIWTFTVFFGFLIPVLPILDVLNHYVTLLFTFFNYYFLNYSVFSTLVNVFFSSIIWSIILYSIYRLINKFWKLN